MHNYNRGIENLQGHKPYPRSSGSIGGGTPSLGVVRSSPLCDDSLALRCTSTAAAEDKGSDWRGVGGSGAEGSLGGVRGTAANGTGSSTEETRSGGGGGGGGRGVGRPDSWSD